MTFSSKVTCVHDVDFVTCLLNNIACKIFIVSISKYALCLLMDENARSLYKGTSVLADIVMASTVSTKYLCAVNHQVMITPALVHVHVHVQCT